MTTEISPKGSLPYGWLIRTSKKYPDRIYYFNQNTGASTWECPELEPPRNYSDSVKESVEISPGEKRKSSESAFSDIDASCERSQKKFCLKVTKKLMNFTEKDEFSIQNSSKSSNNSTDDKKCGNTPTAVVSPVLLKKIILKPNNKKKVSIPNELRALKKETLNVSDKKTFAKRTILSPVKKVKQSSVSAVGIKNSIVDNKNSSCNSSASSLEVNKNLSVSTESVEDIEMLDVSVDLTKIDDLPANKSANYYIVIDTNIFIHELQSIDEIKETFIDGCGLPHIFIPWVVIQELDRIRQRSPKTSVAFRGATDGVKYINRMIKAKHPRFHGQSPKEVKDWAQEYSRNNDDRILECCMSLAEKMPREKVILLTNDINLANKALICNIAAHDIKSLPHYFKSDSPTSNKNKSKKRKSEQILPSFQDTNIKEIDVMMYKVRHILKDVLEHFLETEMKEAYGDVWKAFKIDVSLLKSILEAIARYWKTVFTFHFSEKDRCNFEKLQTLASRPEGFFCETDECVTILTTVEEVFRQIKRIWPKINIPIEEINNIKSVILDISNANVTETSKNETTIESSCYEVVFSVFEHNWNAMNHLCGMVMDFYGIQHGFPYDKPSKFPTEAEFSRLMCNLHPGVRLLKEYMSKIVKKNPKATTPGIKFYKKFAEVLKNFVPSLQIEVQPLDTTHFNAPALQNFCNSPSNYEKISFGYKQVDHFFCKLEEALAAMMSFKKNISPAKMICE